MASDDPYKVVMEALAAQSVAIARLAKEIQVEFAQYRAAIEEQGYEAAERIAAAIDINTARLNDAADQLAASFPGADTDNELPGAPEAPNQGLPEAPEAPGDEQPDGGLPPGAWTKPSGDGDNKPPPLPDGPDKPEKPQKPSKPKRGFFRK